MSQQPETMLDAARRYLERGYLPVPVAPRDKNALLKDWPSLRLGPDDLRKWFGGNNNLGLILGEPSGWLVDVDLDCEEARRLAPRFLPPTDAKTGRPGAPDSHWWYISAGAETRQFRDSVTNKMIVELRSTGGQTLVGPSVHPSGEVYQELKGDPLTIDPQALLQAVEALRHAVECERHGARPPKAADPAPPRPDRNWKSPNKDTPVASRDATDRVPMSERERRCRAYLTKCPEAISGQGGHDATLRAACECFRFGLDRATARSVMDWFNDSKTGGERWNDKEIEHKLDSAETKVGRGEFGVRLGAIGGGDGMTIEDVARLTTDVGNAARLVLQHGHRLRYSYQHGSWLAWDDRRWVWDRSGASVHAAKQTALSVLDEAKPTAGTDEFERKTKWARTSQHHARITAALALAQPDLSVLSESLDSDPWLLNCLNGTLNVRTGELRPHDPADLITRLAPVRFEPAARCPRFMDFLDRIFAGDEDLIAFVRSWHAYCLTGDIRHQYLPIYHGDGNNGKSVLLDTIALLMGDYASTAPPDMLTVRKHNEHPTEIADLLGRRLVVASETEQDAELRIQLVKRVTGDARLKARFMRQDYFEFDRTHKMVLVTNNRPVITEATEAIWRRLLLVPFGVVIPPGERDPGLCESLRDEHEGILAWLVGGFGEALEIPDSIRLATDTYRGRRNSFEEFLDAECDLGDGAVTLSSEISDRYHLWAKSGGRSEIKGKSVGAVLRSRGCQQTMSDRARAWRGISLKAGRQNAHNHTDSPVDAL